MQVARADYEGISGRYNQLPNEDDVKGVDNMFVHSEPCTPDASSGLYGSEDPRVSQYLSFYYQVETMPLLDATTVNNELLIPIEDSISRTILPELFAETCAPLAEARSGSRRFLTARGLSTRPADQVLEGGASSYCLEYSYKCITLSERRQRVLTHVNCSCLSFA